MPFWAQILTGLVLGVLLGWAARSGGVDWLGTGLEKTGDIFVQLLKLAVAPLVFFAIAISITNLRNVSNAARLAGRTLLWFLATSLIAVAIGLAIGLLTDPGAGTGLTPEDGARPESAGSWLDFLTGIVPTDVITPFTELNVLQIVFMAAVTGVAALKLGDRAEPLLAFGESVLALLQKALWWVIRLAPLGTLGLIGNAINRYGWDLIGQYATFTADVYIGCALVMFGVYPLLLGLVARVSPLQFFRGAWPAIQLAFVSRSSVGTMPVTQKVVERLGVPKEYASFSVPFGATTKMDGCAAIYPALAAIFVAEIFGVSLGAQDYLLIAFVSVVGSAATAGLTGATVMTTLTLSTLGLPLEGVGLLLAIDPVLDMIRTATNVTGQAVVPVLVSARERILDTTAFAKATSFDLDTWDDTPAEPTAPVPATAS
ncbi:MULTISPECIES: dicarboxylate/amino acid:cation symporter [unclassified Streptomyces]|uniref:dicarboxylate/amino acid:cation symporter n=1 Tax=unclassified Streptomyces TaxID=2593676 RepID=UPI0022B74627|nr:MULTISPECIES: dicarboxylate/amino acid:cation symporter [unclassified Streptomyces]MCZ7417390.1 dicarboxylate/amino acid:cation symporter [Streptomyces sp. WMMC897]MCZ7432783.1 dicarboxylate/amino acid:cation symporter [Streptomyces sp. WMMC1477]